MGGVGDRRALHAGDDRTEADGDIATADDLLGQVLAGGLTGAGAAARARRKLLAAAGTRRGRGVQTRIGMEDTLRLPDGSTAADNAALVSAAVQLLSR